ncbi:glutamated carboxypeptidase [Orobanche gracilis]
MASLVSNLSSSLSHLSLFRQPSFRYSIKALQTFKGQRKLSKLVQPLLHASSNYVSFSSRPKSRTVNASRQAEELVVLGIETSCDDTAAAVVRSDGEILGQVVSSQAELLVQYGGVAPKMAEEAHSRVIDQVVQEALDKANLTERDLSAVAVTIGPGLSLCLRLLDVPAKNFILVITIYEYNLIVGRKKPYRVFIAFRPVGVRKARKLAGAYTLPIVGVHHMEAHALVARLVEKQLQFPFMALLVSGGHNLLILARDLGHYIQLGTTIDDAIGEAYDKTAKWLGLDMRKSGGPAVEELAREGDENSIGFKVPMKQHKDCNFSYAGLKTQVRLAIESKNINAAIPITSASNEDRQARADIAASFQKGVSRKYIDIIKDMYEGASTSVRSALSPFLFAIVMDELTRGIQNDVPWCMMFADDIVLIDETKDGVQQKLELWRDTLEARGFRLSRSKTEYMECRFSDNSDREAEMITFDGKVVHGSTFFRYLESIIQKDGELDGDVAHRIKAGWLKWKSATGVLCDPDMPHRLKGKFYRTTIRPALLYGTECWAVKQCHVQKMNVAEMRMLRWMCGHTKKDRLRNEVIREKRVAVLHLEDKCERAIEWGSSTEPSIKYLVVSGGVASNQYVRDRLSKIVEKKGLQLVCPPPSLCTDNGVMIAWTGIEHFRMGRYDPPPPACEPEDALLDLRPRWPLGEEYAQGRSEARSLKTARIHPSLTSLIQASLRQPS